MNKLKITGVLLCLMIFPISASATFIDNNTNLSAEWTRMQARTGSFDSMDAITYNPAGTVKMEDGFYLSLQNQVLPKAYSHEYNGVKYEADNTTTFVPGFFAMNKKGKWSQFAGVNVIGGGGSLEYPDSIYTKMGAGAVNLTPGMESIYTSVYMGLIAGGAFSVNEKLSVSLAGRLVYGLNSLEIEDGDVLELEKTAVGFAPIIGINYQVNEKLNIGFRHEFKTSLEFEVDEMKGSMAPKMQALTGIKKGNKARKDFPALSALGASYMITKKLKLAADFTYCWNEEVNWDEDPKGDNAWELGLGAEYEIKEGLKISTGYSYVDAGLDVDDYSTAIGKNPYHLFGGGFMISPMKNMNLNFGASRLFYDEKTDSRGIKYEKELWILGAGIEYRFD